jgi:hypothetical protein
MQALSFEFSVTKIHFSISMTYTEITARLFYYALLLQTSPQTLNGEFVSSINLSALSYSYTITIQLTDFRQKHHIAPYYTKYHNFYSRKYTKMPPWEEHLLNPYRLPTERREWMRPISGPQYGPLPNIRSRELGLPGPWAHRAGPNVQNIVE